MAARKGTKAKDPLKPKRKQSPAQLANLKKIKKGQVLNPEGKNGDKATMAFRSITNEMYVELIELVNSHTVDELEKIAFGPGVSALKRMYLGIIIEDIRKNNMARIEHLMTRVVGQPKQHMDVTSKGKELKNGLGMVTPLVIIPANGSTKEENEALYHEKANAIEADFKKQIEEKGKDEK
jgi:hypothetical protein